MSLSHFLQRVTRMSQYPWHWMICFVPLPCQSGINTTQHTPRVSQAFVLCVRYFQSTECNFRQLSPPQQQISREFSARVNVSIEPYRGSMSAMSVCSVFLCNASVTSVPSINIASLNTQSPLSPVSMHQQLLIHQESSADITLPSCIRHKPTFVL